MALKCDAIEWNRETGDFDVVIKTPTVLLHDNKVFISGLESDCIADYYQEFGQAIHPELEKWATKHHCCFQWENPGLLAVYRD